MMPSKQTSDFENKILSKIDDMEDEIVGLTQKLIQIPSINPPGDYREISEFLAKYLDRLGLEVETVEAPTSLLDSHGLKPPRPNVMATFSFGEAEPVLFLNGHQDVVPEGLGWTMEPFKGIVRDGKVYGRGAADMKGTLAAMIMSVKALKELKAPLRGTVKLVFCVDEETGGAAGAEYVADKLKLRGDYCVSEGGLDSITRAWNGAWWFNVVTRGKSVHDSRRWEGVNAIEKMAKVMTSLTELQGKLVERGESKIPGIRYGTINFGAIQGGKEVNTVPNKCTLTVSRRIIPEERLEAAKREVAETLAKLRGEDSEFEAEVETLFQTDSQELPEGNRLVSVAREASERAMGEALEVKGTTAFIDGRFFMKRGIPTIGLGVEGEGLHGPDECAEISQLVQATKIYSLIAYNLLGSDKKANTKTKRQ